jgi:hypothetical protein
MKYIQLKDGDCFEIEKTGGVINFSCCDCGLVHRFAISIEKNGNIGFALERNNRATGQRRRHNKFDKK